MRPHDNGEALHLHGVGTGITLSWVEKSDAAKYKVKVSGVEWTSGSGILGESFGRQGCRHHSNASEECPTTHLASARPRYVLNAARGAAAARYVHLEFYFDSEGRTPRVKFEST